MANVQPSKHLTEEIVKAVSSRSDGNRAAVLKDIENTLGIVPGFFKGLPDELLEHAWKEMRDFELSDQTSIPPKYKELIGLAVAAATHCHYCSKFHSEAAKMQGATADEINEALLMAKETRGWSSYLNGLRYDVDVFDREVDQIRSYVEKSAGTKQH